ncbi:MAG: phage tail tape measure protein [Thermoguttaceae bacterium]|jgi:hypothetical protein|nr:phage tail tape measure protein [Thermoguttaceae bacterium]
MAKAQGIRAGQAFVELFADDSRLVRGLKAASQRLKDWGQSIGAAGKKMLAAGLGVLGSLAGAGKLFADMGSQLADMSARTGVSVEALSELGYAAEMSGGDMETLEGGLRKMQKAISEAASGSETARESLAALGITIADLKDLSPDEQFMRIADRLAQIKNPTQRAAAAMEVFGRSGTRLLPMMTDGAQGLEAMRQKARDLGMVMSSEDAAAADELGDALDTMWKSLKRGVFAIGAALAPTLQDLAERVTSVMATIGNWISQNRDVITTVFKVAAAVAAGGAALVALGWIFTGLGAAFGAAATIITGVGTALGTIGAVLGAIVSQVGLVIAALASLGGYFLYVSGAGQQALSWLGNQFAALRDTALAAWQGISDALAAGDLSLAAKILWLTLKMEWQKGGAWLTDKWVGFKEAFMAVATEAVYGTAKILTSAWAGLQTAWVETVAFMSKAWTVFTSSLVTGWKTAQNWIAKKFVSLMAMFDETVDVEGAQKILDEDFQAEQRQREQATQARLREIETTRQAKRRAIDQEEEGTLDQLNQEKDARHVARKKQYDADVQAAEDAVAEARRRWQAALDEAARKRAEIPQTAGPERVKGIDDLKGFDFEGLAQRSVSVTGTFNPLAAAGLGTGGPMERTARATAEIAKDTRVLARVARELGLEFD